MRALRRPGAIHETPRRRTTSPQARAQTPHPPAAQPPADRRPTASPLARALTRAAAITAGVSLAVATLMAGATSCTTGEPSPSGAGGGTTTARVPATGAAPATGAPATGAPQPLTVTPFWIRGTTVAPGQPRPVETGTDPIATAVAAVEAGPNEAEQQAGLGSTVLAGAGLYSSSLDGDVATINLARIFYSTTRDARPQVAQMVFTLTSLPTVKRVKFLIEGQPNGAIGVQPLGRDDFPDMAPPVLLATPYPGQEVAGHAFKLSGTTVPGIAGVPWRMEDAGGSPVASGSVPAETTRATAPRLRLLQELKVPDGITGPVVLVVDNVDPAGTPREPFRIPLVVQP